VVGRGHRCAHADGRKGVRRQDRRERGRQDRGSVWGAGRVHTAWPRELVRLIDLTNGLFTRGATLELAGMERFPVTSDGDDSTNKLIELLSR
jgi:hypothetical protein